MMTSHIAIVGDGAIGSLLAAGAQRNHSPYSVLLRRQRPAVTNVVHMDGTSTTLHNHEPVTLSSRDLLIVPVKYYQLASAIAQWRHLLCPDTPVVLLQNGMGGHEVLTSLLPNNPLYLATTSHGALKVSAQEVKHTGMGETKLGVIAPVHGASNEQAWLNNRVTAQINACLPPVLWQQNIQAALWEKLAINLVINPLTAIDDVTNGALKHPRYQRQIHNICSETAMVMTASGFPTDTQSLVARVRKVIAQTANNYSSMHQDIHHGRQSEIEGISGFLVRQAKKTGIDVPTNTGLYQKIRALSLK